MPRFSALGVGPSPPRRIGVRSSGSTSTRLASSGRRLRSTPSWRPSPPSRRSRSCKVSKGRRWRRPSPGTFNSSVALGSTKSGETCSEPACPYSTRAAASSAKTPRTRHRSRAWSRRRPWMRCGRARATCSSRLAPLRLSAPPPSDLPLPYPHRDALNQPLGGRSASRRLESSCRSTRRRCAGGRGPRRWATRTRASGHLPRRVHGRLRDFRHDRRRTAQRPSVVCPHPRRKTGRRQGLAPGPRRGRPHFEVCRRAHLGSSAELDARLSARRGDGRASPPSVSPSARSYRHSRDSPHSHPVGACGT